jgi:tetratricopeptide (TPR) repeat protein
MRNIKVCTIYILLLAATTTIAQGQTIAWPSPEVEQMYNEAREQNARGNLRQAITLYQQALQIAPGIMVLYRELGKAYSLAGANEEAQKTLEPIIKSGDADEQTFQALGTSYYASGSYRKAKSTFEAGVERYPHSGIIYNAWGKMYEEDKQEEEGLKTYIKGIEADPGYHLNYYDAAQAYMTTNKPVWAIMYGEMFINMEQQTTRSQETRTMLIRAYNRLFNAIAREETPRYGKKQDATASSTNGFEEAVYSIYIKLTPVVADGMTTENLTMLRTRFLMDWYLQYAQKYPFTLFQRQDELIRDGYFDIYNQWLFGKAENAAQYDAWNKFHPDAMPDMEEWLKANKFQPTAADAYNTAQLNGIFLKKDNKR